MKVANTIAHHNSLAFCLLIDIYSLSFFIYVNLLIPMMEYIPSTALAEYATFYSNFLN
jgi:hypothetical protein